MHFVAHRAGALRTAPTARNVVTVLVAVVLGSAALVVAGRVLSPPDEVARLEVTNPLAWETQVDLGRPGSRGWIPLGSVDRSTALTFSAVPDEGARWVLRFHHLGTEVAETMTRSELEAAGWRVTVPASLGEALQARGAAPTPDSR